MCKNFTHWQEPNTLFGFSCLEKEMVLNKCSRNARTVVPDDRKEGSKAERSVHTGMDLPCDAGNPLMTMLQEFEKIKRNVQDH